jgi:hypothetical protein
MLPEYEEAATKGPMDEFRVNLVYPPVETPVFASIVQDIGLLSPEVATMVCQIYGEIRHLLWMESRKPNDRVPAKLIVSTAKWASTRARLIILRIEKVLPMLQ